MTGSDTKPVALETRETAGEKLYSPSTARNLAPITDILAGLLPERARVLEIGSGTGEHGEGLCQRRSDVIWQYSDPNPASRASQAVRAEEMSGGLLAPRDLDLTHPDWNDGLDGFDALVCINVIHISPWTVTQALATFAGQHLPEHGVVYLYGPYKEGDATAPSNLGFDESLRSRDPEWGVRDLDRVIAEFENAGLRHDARISMPANNLSLVFRRTS